MSSIHIALAGAVPLSIACGRAAIGADLHRGKGVAGAELPHP